MNLYVINRDQNVIVVVVIVLTIIDDRVTKGKVFLFDNFVMVGDLVKIIKDDFTIV